MPFLYNKEKEESTLMTASSSPEDLRYLSQFLDSLDADSLVSSFDQSAQSGKSKIRVPMLGRKADKATPRLTLRLTPRFHEKWSSVVDELSKMPRTNLPAMRKRASVEFVAAFKQGQFVLEVKEGDKLTAYATPETATDLETGAIELVKKGKKFRYDKIKTISHKDFEAIADHFMTNYNASNEAQAQVTSEAITTSQQPTAAKNVAPPEIAKTAVQATTSQKTATQEELGKKTEGQKQLEQQEVALKAEREERKDQEKIEAAVAKHEKQVASETQKEEESAKIASDEGGGFPSFPPS